MNDTQSKKKFPGLFNKLLLGIGIVDIVILAGSAFFLYYFYVVLEEHWKSGSSIKFILYHFNIATENNAAVWFASMGFALSGFFAIWIFFLEHAKASKWQSYGWLGIAFFFLALSLDEMGSVHERQGLYGIPSWILYAAILPTVIISIYYIRFLFDALKKNPRTIILFVLGFALFVLVVLVESFLEESMKALAGREHIAWTIFISLLEEGLELLGSLLFLSGILSWLSRFSLADDAGGSTSGINTTVIFVFIIAAVLLGILAIEGINNNLQIWLKTGDTGKPQNWIPSIFAFAGAFISVMISLNREQKEKTAYLVLGLVLTGLSVYYGGDFRSWFQIGFFESVNARPTYGIILLAGIGYFILRSRLEFAKKWQRWLFLAWIPGLVFTILYSRYFADVWDVWPFGLLLPVLAKEMISDNSDQSEQM